MTDYEDTRFELVPATDPGAPTQEYILGMIDEIGGSGFGWYADCGVVHEVEA